MVIDDRHPALFSLLGSGARAMADRHERLVDGTAAVFALCRQGILRRPPPRPDKHLNAIVARLSVIARRRHGCREARFPADRALAANLGAVRPDLVATYRERLTRFVQWALARGRAIEARAELDRAAVFFDGEDRHAALAIACSICEGAGEEAFQATGAFQTRFGADPILPVRLPGQQISALSILIAERRYNHPEICRALFANITRSYPDFPMLWRLYIETLIMTGRLDQAEGILGEQRRRYPQEPCFLINAGLIAYKRGDWNEAVAQFQAYQAVSPNEPEVLEHLARARMERNAAEAESGVGLLEALRQDVGLEENEPVRQLLLRFESLGCDCEFGLVQRRFGAEPLSLFRWHATGIDALIDGIACGLDGLGEPANTIMSTWHDLEYYLADRRWGYGFHTFKNQREVAAEEIYPKLLQRLVYLRGKFLEDLEDAEKIFIFKSHTLDEAKFRALHEALRRHGPVRLLCVVRAAEAAAFQPPDGSPAPFVRVIADDLYLGVLHDFGNRPDRWEVPFDAWVALCRESERVGALGADESMPSSAA